MRGHCTISRPSSHNFTTLGQRKNAGENTDSRVLVLDVRRIWKVYTGTGKGRANNSESCVPTSPRDPRQPHYAFLGFLATIILRSPATFHIRIGSTSSSSRIPSHEQIEEPPQLANYPHLSSSHPYSQLTSCYTYICRGPSYTQYDKGRPTDYFAVYPVRQDKRASTLYVHCLIQW